MGNLCIAGPWDSPMDVRILPQFLMHNECRVLRITLARFRQESMIPPKILSLTGLSVIRPTRDEPHCEIDHTTPMKFRRSTSPKVCRSHTGAVLQFPPLGSGDGWMCAD